MPRKPRRGCGYPGCPKLAIDGGQYCEEHTKDEAKRYNLYERDPENVKKYGRSWKKARERYIKGHPLCERCLCEGRYTLVQEVHHIIPISRGGTHSQDNLMSLCRSCHNKIHKELGDR